MANLPISGFPTGGTIAQAGDEFVIARSGANYKLTSSSISAFVLGGPTTQLGAADVASGAVAQTLQVQSNTGAATTGPNFTIKGSSGTTAGGSIIFQTHNGTAYGTALTINSAGKATFTPTVNSTSTFQITDASGNEYFNINVTNSYVSLASGVAAVNRGTGVVTIYDAGQLGWTAAGTALTGPDTILRRDGQPNTLALKNAGNAQIFRVYSTTTGPSYGYFASGVTDAGVAAADTLFIGTGGAGAAMTKLALVVNGTSALSFSGVDATFPGASVNITKANAASSDTTLNFVGDFGNGAQLIVARNGSGSGYPAHSFNLQLNGSSDGFIIRDNNIFRFSFTRAGLFRIGGTTSSFPALKYSSTGVPLQVRLADDSGDAAFQCGTATSGGTAFNVNGTGGNSIASVTNTTTGTLLQVLNSTSNPLMTVTDTTSGTLFSVQSTTAATLFSVNDTTSGTLLAVTNSSSTDVFNVTDTGRVLVNATYDASNANYSFNGDAGTGLAWRASSQLSFLCGTNEVARVNTTNGVDSLTYNISASNGGRFGLGSGGTNDTFISRVAARTVSVRGTSSTPGILSLATYSAAGTAITSASTAGAGAIAFASDATATTPRSTYASGGSNFVMLMSDGTNWLIVA